MPDRPAIYRPRRTTAPTCGSPATRPTAAQRGYSSPWQRARVSFLADNPLCVECSKAGRVVEATVVDHIIPHRGDQTRFWDKANWQALCDPCHNRKTASGA